MPWNVELDGTVGKGGVALEATVSGLKVGQYAVNWKATGRSGSDCNPNSSLYQFFGADRNSLTPTYAAPAPSGPDCKVTIEVVIITQDDSRRASKTFNLLYEG